MTRKSFDIPRSPHQSTLGARRAYSTFFNLTWPHSDSYLRELASDSHSCLELLYKMRETDPVESQPPNEPSLK